VFSGKHSVSRARGDIAKCRRTEAIIIFNAGGYFQKQSVTDFNGHTTTFGVGTDTAGNAGDPDPNIGDRGQVLWVKDAKYGDGELREQFKLIYLRAKPCI
jgi:hypothetical protein